METENRTLEVICEILFIINLKSNMTTGYHWVADFDNLYLTLQHSEYQASLPQRIGSGGIETFEFVGHETGETQLELRYLREWEPEPIKQINYTIIIRDALEN